MKAAVIGIVFNEDQNVLIIKRRDISVWVLPSGGIDYNETPEAAVTREILEETGLHTCIKRKTGEYSPINRLTSLTHVYECKVVGGKPTIGDETSEIRFCPLNAMPDDFFHIHKEWLEDALKNDPEVIKRPITNVTYWKLFIYFLKHPIRVLRALLTRFGLPINK